MNVVQDVEGIVRCYCGCKYWEDHEVILQWRTRSGKCVAIEVRCVDCGQPLNAELCEQLVMP